MNLLVVPLLFVSLSMITFPAQENQFMISNLQPAQVQLNGLHLTKGNAFWFTPVIWKEPFENDGYYFAQLNDTVKLSEKELIFHSDYTQYYANRSYQSLFNTTTHLQFNYVDDVYFFKVDTALTMNQEVRGRMYVEFGTGSNQTGDPRDITLNLYAGGQKIFTHPTVTNYQHYNYTMDSGSFYVLESHSGDKYPHQGKV
jgi:hypothetical protein